MLVHRQKVWGKSVDRKQVERREVKTRRLGMGPEGEREGRYVRKANYQRKKNIYARKNSRQTKGELGLKEGRKRGSRSRESLGR